MTPSTEALLQFAVYAGTNALLLYFELLAVLLILVTVSWRLGHVHVLPQGLRRGPQAIIALKGAIGLVITAGAAAVFVLIAHALARNGLLPQFDAALTATLSQHVTATTVKVFAAFTHLGDTLVRIGLGAAIALLLWRTGRLALAAGLMIAVGGTVLLNPLLKQVFERVRPVYEYGMISEAGWSFPSGHTSGATVTYGMLAYVALRTLPSAWHLPAVLAGAALAFTVGCSRIFLRVHFASDVAAGFAFGIAWLAVCILSVELRRYFNRRV